MPGPRDHNFGGAKGHHRDRHERDKSPVRSRPAENSRSIDRHHKKHKKTVHKSKRKRRDANPKILKTKGQTVKLVEYDDVSSDGFCSDESDSQTSVTSREVETSKKGRHVSPATAIKAYKQMVVKEKVSPNRDRKRRKRDERGAPSTSYGGHETVHERRRRRSRTPEPPRAYRSPSPVRGKRRRSPLSPLRGRRSPLSPVRERRFQTPERRYRSPISPVFARERVPFSPSRSRSRSPYQR